MIDISLCMIVRNEEHVLSNCLDSVKSIVDEIIIVDTGSTDATKEIAGEYTMKIFDFQWGDDFAAARNYSFMQASKEYILWLDADDVLQYEDQIKLERLKHSISTMTDSVTMIYHYAFDEYGNPTVRLRRNRMVKRLNQFQWHGAVHEYLSVHGEILNSDIVVKHTRVHPHTGRNLKIFESLLARGESFSPRDLYYYANELMDNQFYEQALDYYQRFLERNQGWVEDSISACGKLADIYRQRNEPEKEVEYLLKSFNYDVPRAEFCCKIGFLFLNRGDALRASFWFQLATELEPPQDGWGFVQDAYWTWIPHIQLCICFYRLGDISRSYHHNEMARKYRPNDEYILYNKQLLEGMFHREANG